LINQEEIHNQCLSEDSEERIKALEQLEDYFSLLPDKEQAWNYLHRQTNDEDIGVRYRAASALDCVFPEVSDKQKAWNDLIKLTNDEYSDVRYRAVSALASAFFHVPDKLKAWNDLIKLADDEDIDIRREIISALSYSFSHIPDKQLVWDDLHKLISDEDSFVRREVAHTLGFAFIHLPDKQLIWNDLHRLTHDENSDVRYRATSALCSAFSHFPDKQLVWNDLHRLTTDENRDVRCRAASVFGSSFSDVPDKQKAWNDLHKLINDKDNFVRKEAVSALSSEFPYLPDKQLAWNDLHGLINDEDNFVRTEVASALGCVFPHVSDKKLVCNDLNALTNDEDSNVIAYANHSLGKVSIFKASQAETEQDYRKELEKSIEFFEKALQESLYSDWENPSQFCLPFYRSFYTIIFKKQEAKEEVDKYLEEAKSAIEGSKSKEMLFEAVKNLAEALKEVQDLGNLDFEAKKCELDFYRKYCDRAAELIRDTEETAPFATIAMRKGLPILDRNLKRLIEGIQEKAKIACHVSQGTSTQEIACSASKEVRKWGIGSQKEITFNVESFIFTLESKIPKLPENEHIFKMINESKDQKDINKLLENASELIEIIPEITIDPERMRPTIGIITALPKEYVAVNILLENRNDKYKIPGSGAGRRYCLGLVTK